MKIEDMDVIIIEDEVTAARHLMDLLNELDQEISVIKHLTSIADTIEWFDGQQPDLIFMDIHLEDGLSFQIFEQLQFEAPIIFTTGHNDYAIEAFRVNSIDYLLKPVQKEALEQSLIKFRKLEIKQTDVQALLSKIPSEKPSYQKRFLVTAGERIRSIDVNEISYFYGKDKYVYIITRDDHRFIVDHSLTQLESLLDPEIFFRINRQFVISIQAIKEMYAYSRSRVKIELSPSSKEKAIVSSEKSSDFKKWLNR
ncbi:LytTR family DNA-binding domain-containing protein [Ekhidna sp.]|uniref:LytR/AlgR family response regulator transcription factor n=1 Tax=Ekhidna sp. TaxID=2608089 RepID=UPI003297548F